MGARSYSPSAYGHNLLAAREGPASGVPLEIYPVGGVEEVAVLYSLGEALAPGVGEVVGDVAVEAKVEKLALEAAVAINGVAVEPVALVVEACFDAESCETLLVGGCRFGLGCYSTGRCCSKQT